MDEEVFTLREADLHATLTVNSKVFDYSESMNDVMAWCSSVYHGDHNVNSVVLSHFYDRDQS